MIPSLLQIPSAVSDSKLHSVLPNNGKGDFQFDRSTGATRINRDGLIEEVGYFSSELVQNGNFSELGSELVTNGDFATDSNWTKGTGWVIINGYAESDGTTSNLDQTALTTGKTYRATVTVSNMTTGTLSYRIGSNSSDEILSITANGTYTAYGVAGNETIRFRSQSGFDGRIDNVSVKQVDPNDRWTLETGWSYGDNRLNFSGGSSNKACYSSAGITNGKTYKLSFNVLSISAGQVSLRFGGMAGVDEITATSTGIHSGIITANSSAIGTVQIEDNDNNFVGSISNVSVVEVQGDRPRLSYDITNGVVEDKPHLLLEPSSTNSFPFSENFSDSSWSKQSGLTCVHNTTETKTPAGTFTASKLTGNGSVGIFNTSISVSGVVSRSVYLKSVTGNVNVLLKDSSSVQTTASVTEEWQRFTLTGDKGTSSQGLFVDDIPASGVYIWGAQLEQQSYATSYIPTAGTTITRAAETCNNSKPSVNSTEGVLYAEIKGDEDGGNRFIAVSNGDITNCVRVIFISNNIIGQIRAGGSEVFYIATSGISIEQYNKIAVSYKLNQCKLFVNGSQIGATDTSASMPTGLNTLEFAEGNGTDNFYGKVKGLAVYNEALSESQLMQLTGVTASSIYNNFVTRTASFTVEALNEVKKVIDNL